ncbi:MAG: cation acetate symporter [Geobacter sp.]
MSSSPVQLIPLMIVAAMFALFVLGGMGSKMRQASDYGFAGNYSGRLGSGAAIASNWMSAASILGLAGLFYLKGYYAMAFVIGWTGGYILLLVLLATQIRRFGKFTAPDFVGFRYESGTARTLAALISIMISIIYCIAQVRGVALLVSWLFGIGYQAAVVTGGALVVTFVVISGTLGVVRNQRLQYFVLIVAFVLPLMFLTKKLGYFWVLPQFGYGQAIIDLQTQFGFYWSEPFATVSLYHWLALCFTLMFGTAGLPHVLSRFYMAPSIRDARWGVVWGLFFISLIYWSAPAYGVLARLYDAKAGLAYKTPDPATADLVTLTAALQGGIPVWVVGLLVAGGLAAAFYAISGLLQNGAAAFAYDIYPRLMRPSATDSDKLTMAKGFFLVLAAAVLALSLKPVGMIAETAAVAFALAGNTIFPAFLMGIWWSRTNAAGVVAGMLVGVAISFSAPLLGGVLPVVTTLFPLTSSAFLGAPLVVVVMIVVSLLTRPPSDEIVGFLARNVHDVKDR